MSTGYLLAVAVVMPLSGWATERYGGKAMWTLSVALFVGGSTLCGLAWSAPALLGFRVLQGLGGGMMQPIGQAMMAQHAGPSRMARVMSVASIPVMFAPVLGPILGGVILTSLDWRWMFLVNLPIGVGTLLVAARVLPAGKPRASGRRLDVLGLALLSPGLAALVFGLSNITQPGAGPARTVVPSVLGAILLLAYGLHALRGRSAPLVDLRLFARRGFAVATGSSFLLGASLYSSMLLVPLFYQQVRHADALRAGLLLAPQALGTALATATVSRLAGRIGPRTLMITGIVASALGTVAFTQVGSHPPAWMLTASLLLRGAGLGATMAPGMATVYASVERHEAPRAATALNVLNRIGGSLGTAVLVVLLQGALARHATVSDAFGEAFWWALLLSLLSLVPAILLPDRLPSRTS